MWSDERGSEVLSLPECRAFLTMGYRQYRYGHLGFPGVGAPIVLPIDYGLSGPEPDVLIRVGRNVRNQVVGRLVSFQVDGVAGPISVDAAEGERYWSVLVRGLAIELPSLPPGALPPRPRAAFPGPCLIRIRSDVLTGRRLGTLAHSEPRQDADALGLDEEARQIRPAG